MIKRANICSKHQIYFILFIIFLNAHLGHQNALPCVLVASLVSTRQSSWYNKNVYHLFCHPGNVANLYCKSGELIRGSLFRAKNKFDRGIYSLACLKYDNLLIPLVPMRKVMYLGGQHYFTKMAMMSHLPRYYKIPEQCQCELLLS